MSVKTVIEKINEELSKTFVETQGLAVYGLTELIPAKNKDGSTYVLPGEIDKTGEIKYVGFDDRNPLIVYHRLVTAAQIERTGFSYGDERTDQITTYSNGLYIYADRKIVCTDQSGLLELIQTALPASLIIQGYKNIIIRVLSVNFNTQQILRSEYQGTDAKLRPERVLIQINYQIETTFRKKCASRCT